MWKLNYHIILIVLLFKLPHPLKLTKLKKKIFSYHILNYIFSSLIFLSSLSFFSVFWLILTITTKSSLITLLTPISHPILSSLNLAIHPIFYTHNLPHFFYRLWCSPYYPLSCSILCFYQLKSFALCVIDSIPWLFFFTTNHIILSLWLFLCVNVDDKISKFTTRWNHGLQWVDQVNELVSL